MIKFKIECESMNCVQLNRQNYFSIDGLTRIEKNFLWSVNWTSAAKFARESDPPSFFAYPTERRKFLGIQEVKGLLSS